ncbi:MAG: hypothetical protein LBU32_14085 [Clostridiales bacterium]|jgi:hypothetical protein|nr:hypothetical protein [Clostridiales bacterium]
MPAFRALKVDNQTSKSVHLTAKRYACYFELDYMLIRIESSYLELDYTAPLWTLKLQNRHLTAIGHHAAMRPIVRLPHALAQPDEKCEVFSCFCGTS